MELTDMIICPYLTEKTYSKRTEENKKYAFIVNTKANKNDIAIAFETIFNINPIAVKTMIRKQVATKTGTAHPGFTKSFKIAYVTLPKGKDIALSNEDLKTKNKVPEDKKANTNPSESINNNKNITIKEVSKHPNTSSQNNSNVEKKHDPKKSEISDKKTAWTKQTTKNY